MKRLILALLALVALVLIGGALYVRSLLDPDNVRQALERQASAALGQPVRIAGADLAFWPRAGVTLTGLAIGEPAALTLARTQVSTELRALIDRRIVDAEVIVQDSELDLPLVLATLERLAGSGGQAPVATPAPAGGTDEPGGITLVNVRTIELDDVRIRAGARAAVFSLKASLSGDRLEIPSGSITSDVTSLTVSGAVESLTARKGTLSIDAATLDLDGLLAFAQEFARHASGSTAAQSSAAEAQKRGGGSAPAAPPKPGPLDMTLSLTSARGRAAGIDFEQLKASAVVTPGRIRLEPFSIGVFGGRLEGAVDVDQSAAEPALALSGTLAGVNMTRLMEFAGQPGAITGTLSGSLAVSGSGADPAVALARARGNGTAAITDGTMKGLQLVRPIVLAFGQPDAAQPVEGGEKFSRMGATYALAGGVVTLSDLRFESRDVSLDGGGTLRVASRALDIKANARLSKELTAQAGRDLVRYTAENGQVTVPATVKGTIDAPDVGINLGSVASRAAKNELQRQTESVLKGLLGKKPPKQ
jgi:uncharacterized protein involved in outer membrane biogenesis